MPALTVLVTWPPHTPPSVNLLSAPERHIASPWPAWRRQEWAAARLTARAALHLTWGFLPAAVSILRAQDGAPVLHGAPQPTTLSLTHTQPTPPGSRDPATLVTACTVHSGTGKPVGVDLEYISDANKALVPRIAPNLRQQQPGPLTATLLWACKEAAFKACRIPHAHMADFDVQTRAGSLTISPAPHLGQSPLRAWPTRLNNLVLVSAGPGLPRPQLLTLTARQALRLTLPTEGPIHDQPLPDQPA